MGVYIKGMEMPPRCGRCDMRISAYDDGMFDHYECCITAAIIDNLGEKMEDCPLFPAPPHGRLIDADALAETTDGIWDCNDLYFQPNDKICDPNDCKGCKWRETMDCFRRMVKHAPTIIPAEEVET